MLRNLASAWVRALPPRRHPNYLRGHMAPTGKTGKLRPDDTPNIPQLEQMLKDVVLALRAQRSFGNITLRIPETSDLVAILRVDPVESYELETMLRSQGASPIKARRPA
jgi:hypothetical protein